MTLYAIRQKHTGWYLPQRSNGHTQATPQDCSTGHTLPRLHTTRKGAREALSLWCRGALMWSHDESGRRESLDWHQVPGRNWDDMEVVRMVLADYDARDDIHGGNGTEVHNGNDSSNDPSRPSVAGQRRDDPEYTAEDRAADLRTPIGTAYC